MSVLSKHPITLTAEILAAYVAHNSLPAAELPNLLTSIHVVLCGLDTPSEGATPVAKPSPAQIRASIRHDTLISFEDGRPYKALRRHLTMRGISPEQYRAKWGLPVDYPLVSPAYSARRSAISREIGRSTLQRSAWLEAAE